MSEKLIIRNFGPITNVELDLRRVNVLIGDQGTGKSTVAKILSVIKGASQLLLGRIIQKINGIESSENEVAVVKNERFSLYFFDLLKQYDLNNYISDMTYIFFENCFCVCKFQDGETFFSTKEPNPEDGIKKDTSLNYFIPAFRESYILLRNSYPAILRANATLPHLLNDFGQYFNNYREKLKYFDFKDIIGVDYRYIDGSDFIVLESGAIITFEESSSAVNSVVPMLVVFLGVINDMSEDSHRVYHRYNCPFITIEEPELNCYPETQKKLVENLIEKIKFKDFQKSNEYYSDLLLTTHSPYILTSLNNLMYAYEVGKLNSSEAEKVIDKRYWLNPNDVSAYQLKKDGTCDNIFNREENLISAGRIDEISNILNEQFDALLNIELTPR